MEDSRISEVMNTVNEIHDQVMKLNLLMNTVYARLEAVEKMYTSNNIAPKRTIKVTQTAVSSNNQDDDVASVSSDGSKRKQVTATVNSQGKIINALTFFKKYIMASNYNDLRNKYATQEMINTAKLNVGTKKPENTEEYWVSIGNTIWKLLDKDQKKDIREDFNKWKKVNQITTDPSQLNEDEVDNDV